MTSVARPAGAPKSDYNKLRDIAVGMEIFQRYGGRFADAEHDVLYAGPDGDKDIAPEDKAKLEAANWHWDREVDSWAIFT